VRLLCWWKKGEQGSEKDANSAVRAANHDAGDRTHSGVIRTLLSPKTLTRYRQRDCYMHKRTL